MKKIDGFDCYSPELAILNDGFDPESFKLLYEVEDKSFWFVNRNKILKHLVQKFDVKNNFLEVGCGSAYVINHLSVNIPNVKFTGSEIYIEGLKLAEKRVKESVNLIQLNALDLNLPITFGGIGAFDVIEHISEDEQVLVNFYNNLSPNGLVFITVPQFMFMWSQEDNYACHKRRYSRKELRSKLNAAGFKIEYITSYMFILFPLMVISRLIGRSVKKTPEELNKNLYPGKLLNMLFTFFTKIDVLLIKLGVSLPWGGSLIIIGRKVV
jgi:SAM-dependent methyltransferase